MPNGEAKDFQVTIRSDGIWVFLDDDEKALLNLIGHDSDRAVALIVGSMIELRIKRAVLARLQRDKKVEERLFQPNGPLGSFSAKIDLARLIGLITPEAHHDLRVFKDIRNAFAHELNLRDFRSQGIKDLASNFRLIDGYVAEADGTKKERVTFRFDAKPMIFTKHADARKKRARDRYLMTAQLFTIRFAPYEIGGGRGL